MRTISKNEARQRVADGENVYIVYAYDEFDDCLAQIELNNGSLCTVVSCRDVDELVNVRYQIITDKGELPFVLNPGRTEDAPQRNSEDDNPSETEDDNADENDALQDAQVILTIVNTIVNTIVDKLEELARYGLRMSLDSSADMEDE